MWTRSLFPKLFALNPLPWYRVQLWRRFCPFFVAAIVSPRLDAVRGRLIHLGWSMIVSDDHSWTRVTSLTPNQILTTAGRANNLRAISKCFYPIRRPPHSKWVLQKCLGLKGLRGWGLLAKVISSALAPWWQPHQTALHKSEPPKKLEVKLKRLPRVGLCPCLKGRSHLSRDPFTKHIKCKLKKLKRCQLDSLQPLVTLYRAASKARLIVHSLIWKGEQEK